MQSPVEMATKGLASDPGSDNVSMAEHGFYLVLGALILYMLFSWFLDLREAYRQIALREAAEEKARRQSNTPTVDDPG